MACSRMPPTAPCCGTGAEASTRTLHGRSRRCFPRSSRASRKWWRATGPKRVYGRRPRSIGNAPASWGNWYTNLITGRTEQALGMADELVEVAERLADPDLMLEAYHSRWANSHVLGLNSITLADTERGIALYDPERHHAHAYDYGGHDTGVCAYAHSAITFWVTGFAEKATQMSVAALELGNRLGHPPSLAHAAWWSAALRQMLRAPELCREYAELTIRIGREQGSNMFVVCPLLLGWTTYQSGEVSEGLERTEDAV